MAVFKAKTATRDGRRWYYSVCYQTANGERKRKKGQLYATKGEAQEAERQFLLERTHNRVDITFEEMYYQYIRYAEERIKGSTKYCKDKRIKNHLVAHFGNMNIHDITVEAVIAWKIKINASLNAKGKSFMLSTKRILFTDLRTILKYGVNFCGLRENVGLKVAMFHDQNEKVVADEDRLRYITPDEYNLFTSVIKKPVFKTFFAFLYYMGVRKGEAQALTWEDIFWGNNQVRIIKTITTNTDELNERGIRFKITNTKNRKNRTIKMPLILKNMLLELYQYYKEFEGFNDSWFVFGGDRCLSGCTVDFHRKRYFELIEKTYGKAINRITNHEFRHSHASYLISKGIKIEQIAYRLGDTVEVALKVYAHLFPEVEDKIIEELDLIESGHNSVP